MLHEFDETLRVNVRGVFLGCKYGVEQMLSQTPIFGQDRGWSESYRRHHKHRRLSATFR